jgi:hypothetical protein
MCKAFSSQLTAYIDDELPIDERFALDQHLPTCASCQADLKALREAVAFSSLLPELAPPADLRMKIYARTIHRKSLRVRIGEALLAPRAWRYAAGFAAVAGILAYGLHSGRSPQRMAANVSPMVNNAPVQPKSETQSKPQIAAIDLNAFQKKIENALKEVKSSFKSGLNDNAPKSEAPASEAKPTLIADAPTSIADAQPKPVISKVSFSSKRAPSAPAAKANKLLLGDLSRNRKTAAKPSPEPFDSVPTVGSPTPMPDHQPATATDAGTRNGAPSANPDADPSKNGETAIASRPRPTVADDLVKLTNSRPTLKVEEKKKDNFNPVNELMDQLSGVALSSAPQLKVNVLHIRVKL